MCSQSPKHFLREFCYLQNQNKAQIVKWEPWLFQLDLLDLFGQYKDLIILKARQLGITWLVSLYSLWQVLFRDSAKVLLLSQGENEAWEVLGKSRFIYQHLPSYMKISTYNDTRAWMSFNANYSEIKALPSTDKAGRGTNATLVARDELAKHPFGEDNFASIMPAINAGGQLIDLSTIDKQAVDNHFTDRVEKSLNGATKQILPSGIELYTGGESGAVLIFLGWRLRPVREEGITLEEWFEKWVRKKFTPVVVEQEYPATINEALRPPQTNAFFDIDSLNSMELQIDNPIKDFKGFDTFNGKIRVYKPPAVGRSYCVFTDPSNGIEDPFVTGVMDKVTAEVVAVATEKLPAQEVARIHDFLVRQYNNAYNSGEVNAQAGGSFVDTLKSLATPNIVPRRDDSGKIIEGKIGWWTSPPLRDKGLHDLAAAIYERQITLHDREAIDEMRNFIRDGNGKLRASGKRHDDWVIMLMGLWQVRKYAPVGKFAITSTFYRD